MELSKNWDVKLKDCTRFRGGGVADKKKFGVEIECEGTDLPNDVFGWNAIAEGSLRGESKEYVVDGAVDFLELDTRLSILAKEAAAHGTVVNEASHRASTHIHYNVQHRTLKEITGSILCFLMVEPVLMRLAGPMRDGNLFCLPTYDCGDMPVYMGRLGSHIEMYGQVANLDHRGKYSSLNTNTLTRFGTLETRVFPCSVNKPRVLQWARVVDGIMTRGAAFNNWKHEISTFYENPRGLLGTVFTPRMIDGFSDHQLNEMVELGAENAWDSAHSMETSVLKTRKELEDARKRQDGEHERIKKLMALQELAEMRAQVDLAPAQINPRWAINWDGAQVEAAPQPNRAGRRARPVPMPDHVDDFILDLAQDDPF